MLVIAVTSEGLAARKASKDPGVPRPSAQASVPDSKTAFTVRQKKVAPETPARKSRRSMKTSRKTAVKAVVQPRTDLIPYGMLEDSQRYDPRPRAVSAGVPSPQRLDLTHDHFQELDRNQDGKIDPVERAFGRIDMDRDLPTRPLR
jgi:hypothetical protein